MKIDTALIPDYDKLTPQEKLDALEKLELPDPDLSEFVPRDTADKFASEAASLKKQLRERMSDAERQKQQQLEVQEQLKAEVEALRRERAVERSRNRLLELGWSSRLAESAALALAAGDMDKVFDAFGKFKEEFTRQLKGELLKQTPPPPGGNGARTMTREQFEAMTLSEKAALFQEQPEVYAQFRNGG